MSQDEVTAKPVVLAEKFTAAASPQLVTFVCPECGEVLIKGKHDPSKHAKSHWPVDANDINRVTNETARQRYKALLNAFKGV